MLARSVLGALAIAWLLPLGAAGAAPSVIERVSVDSTGNEGNDHSFAPAISATGRFVAFDSYGVLDQLDVVDREEAWRCHLRPPSIQHLVRWRGARSLHESFEVALIVPMRLRRRERGLAHPAGRPTAVRR